MSDVHAFFTCFAEDFPQFRGDLIATRYATPYMAVKDDGSATVYSTTPDIAAYFQTHLDRYRDAGCAACSFTDLQVQPLGATACLATLTWVLCTASGAVVSRWRESYHLVRGDDGLKVRVSMDHAE